MGVFDAKARMYDPLVPRFWSIDQMSEQYESWTGYNYVFNSPVNWTDPDGRCPTCPEGDDVYSKGAVVENQYGKWTYLGGGNWETHWQSSPINPSTGQPFQNQGLTPVYIEFALMAPASLPFKTGSKIANFALEAMNPVGGLGLAKGGRGAAEKIFEKVLPTVSIRTLDFLKVRITEKGLSKVIEHLSRFGPDAANAEMITDGTLQATEYDLKFYTHELREFVRYRVGKVTNEGTYEFYSSQHAATLMDYGIPVDQTAKFLLYHPNAVKAAGKDF